MKVKVYFNLHRKVFSVVNIKTGKVAGYSENLCLKNAQLRVQESGRQRVLREKRKNVHAFVRGDAAFFRYTNRQPLDTLTYNPYKYVSFVDKQTEEPVYKASRAWLSVTDKIPTIQAEGVQHD